MPIELAVDPTIERRLAVAGARTTIEMLAWRVAGGDADNLPTWDVDRLAADGMLRAEHERQHRAIAEAVRYLEDLGLIERPGPAAACIRFTPQINDYTEDA